MFVFIPDRIKYIKYIFLLRTVQTKSGAHPFSCFTRNGLLCR